MADTIKHRHQSVMPNSGADIDVDEWNDSLVVAGGTNGQLMTRDNTQADGWKWTDPPVSGGSAWTLVATQACGGAANYDFTGLSAYNSLRVLLVAVTLSSSGEARLRCSTDNGLNFLSTSGDYLAISGAGASSNVDAVEFYTGSTTSARYGELLINGFNVAGAPKTFRATFFSSDSVYLRFSATTTAFNAIRVFATAGNLNGGTIYVLGQQ